MHVKLFATRPLFAGLLMLVLGGSPVFSQTSSSSSASAPGSGGYSIVQRGPHSRVWQRTTLTTNQSGVVSTNLHSYTELRTGVCYLQNGQYVDSVEQVNIVGSGAETAQGPCKVQWAPDASTAGGAVQLTSPGGQQFKSRVYGLALMDMSTGSNVLIAQITNSTGVLTGSNQIVYPSTFSGLEADIQDTYRLSGFEQNVILREQPPSAEDCGLNPETTWLVVLTEFFNPPVPQITTIQTNGLSDNVNLKFKGMSIGRGTAFLTPGQGRSGRVKVFKQWEKLDDGRVFLIERVPYQAMTNFFQALPAHSSTIKPGGSVRRTASLDSLLRDGKPVPKKSGAIKVAQTIPQGPGLVIDYSMQDESLTNFVFQGDTTYYVSGTVNLYGAPVFEGGTVVKYANTSDAGLVLQDYNTNFVFDTSTYQPAVFTSSDDDSVGVKISGSSGAPWNNDWLNTYLCAMNTENDNVTIENARFSYAGTAFYSYNDWSHIFQDCQFVDCGTNAVLWDDYNVSFLNVLAANCGEMLAADGIEVDGENMTLDYCALADTNHHAWGPYDVGLINCILTALQGPLQYSYTTTNHKTGVIITHSNLTTVMSSTLLADSGDGIYQTVGAGSYYLADGSTNQNAGESDINPALLADLQTLTTYPPVLLDEVLATNTTFSPQAPRNTGPPDLGYHYPPIDYAISIAISNASVTVLPGTVLAGCGEGYAVWLYTNATFNCQGAVTNPVYFTRYNAVQEQSNTNWETSMWGELMYTSYWADDGSSANFAFTDWSVLAGETLYYSDNSSLGLQNCQLFNGSIKAMGSTLVSTNCLYRRVNLSLFNQTSTSYSSNAFFNNLFWQGSIFNQKKAHTWPSCWTFQDNLFDSTSNGVKTIATDICSNNAYVTTNFGTLAYSVNDIVLDSSPAYQTGALGNYYYPASLPLIHAGSRSAAAAGLYYYTVTPDNVIEGANTVSIGYHYVAVGTNGLPLASSDGIPYYQEYPNGPGTGGIGGNSGLQVWITEPMNNSMVP